MITNNTSLKIEIQTEGSSFQRALERADGSKTNDTASEDVRPEARTCVWNDYQDGSQNQCAIDCCSGPGIPMAIRIRSIHILKFLHYCVGLHLPTDLAPVEFKRPFQPLIFFHSRMEDAYKRMCTEVSNALEPKDCNCGIAESYRPADGALAHIECYMDFTGDRLLPVHRRFQSKDLDEVPVEFWWSVFRVGELVCSFMEPDEIGPIYSARSAKHSTTLTNALREGEYDLWRVLSYDVHKRNEDSIGWQATLTLSCYHINYDGWRFGIEDAYFHLCLDLHQEDVLTNKDAQGINQIFSSRWLTPNDAINILLDVIIRQKLEVKSFSIDYSDDAYVKEVDPARLLSSMQRWSYGRIQIQGLSLRVGLGVKLDWLTHFITRLRSLRSLHLQSNGTGTER
ncbi:hypothetical protein BDV96DRAFT_684093 [Lophiotrema nucula]|uniref:Uncharacterized protein n=1 Tax=Lophiotrema nucula TaxID=690887 RepID=A0A6A5ZIZ0_9PLEO|nr:hypothetical protein BDV96DRAFT_684093 [Lophiotrema nucula]